MNRTQALTIGIVIGFLVLGVVGVVVLALFPYEQVFAPTSTVTLTSTVTPSPTIHIPLPTARSTTPTPKPPTPINTRVPTITPLPTKSPVPTKAVAAPTIFRPTSTPTGNPEEETPEPTPTAAPRHYTLLFEADKSTVPAGRCTTLRWQSSGPVTLWLEGVSVASSGEQRACPRVDTTYTISFQVAGSSQVQSQRVTVKIE